MKSPSSASLPFRIRPSIVAFGDSITQYGYGIPESDHIGWVSLLSSTYCRRCDVFNRGFSGYNTRNAIDLIPRLFGNFQNNNINASIDNIVDINSYKNNNNNQLLFCTVFFGANDATLPGENQHVPIDEYGDNIDTIIRSIRSTVNNVNNSNSNLPDEPIIILMTPPPIDEMAWAKTRETSISDRTNERARQYGLKMKEIGTKYTNCTVLDTWELLHGHTNDRCNYLYDGLHLNQQGNRLLFDGLMNTIISKQYPHLAPLDDDADVYKIQKVGIRVEEKLWSEFYN